jgi:hypothetical protein
MANERDLKLALAEMNAKLKPNTSTSAIAANIGTASFVGGNASERRNPRNGGSSVVCEPYPGSSPKHKTRLRKTRLSKTRLRKTMAAALEGAFCAFLPIRSFWSLVRKS